MSVRYNEDFKREVVKAYIDCDKTTAEIAAKYNIAKSTVLEWVKKYSKECQYMNATLNFNKAKSAKEVRQLNRLLKEERERN